MQTMWGLGDRVALSRESRRGGNTDSSRAPKARIAGTLFASVHPKGSTPLKRGEAAFATPGSLSHRVMR